MNHDQLVGHLLRDHDVIDKTRQQRFGNLKHRTVRVCESVEIGRFPGEAPQQARVERGGAGITNVVS